MVFEQRQKVLFRHCDPAGIVFFPRYFEMMNDVNEAFFEALRAPWHDLHRGQAVPTAQLETRFTAPSRHGDVLLFQLRVVQVGRTSLTLDTVAECDGERRLHCRATMVHVGADGRPDPWPEELARGLNDYKETPDGT